MFRHQAKKQEAEKKTENDNPDIAANVKSDIVADVKKESAKDVGPAALRELLEKNLKWSQIIYEQNRKINRKLFWYDLSGWLRLIIILVPLALAVIFLPPILQNFWQKYGSVFQNPSNISNSAGVSGQSAIDQLLKLLPVNPAQQEQLKQILK